MIYNKVTLTYDIALLVKQLQLRSVYTTSHTPSQTGETLEGSLSITDAELDLMNFVLRDAANDLYQKVQSLTRNSTTPFLYDFFNTSTQLRTIVYELWLNENWDLALSPALSIACEKILINYCLRDWYSTTGQQLAYQVADQSYKNAEREVRSLIDSRKTPIRRHSSVM